MLDNLLTGVSGKRRVSRDKSPYIQTGKAGHTDDGKEIPDILVITQIHSHLIYVNSFVLAKFCSTLMCCMDECVIFCTSLFQNKIILLQFNNSVYIRIIYITKQKFNSINTLFYYI
jgi:hypothetical protein